MGLRVIKYGAEWCHQCKQQDKEFKNNSLKEGVNVLIVDVETLTDEEIEKLNIKSISDIILQKINDNKEWETIKSWNSFVKVSEINKLIESL